MRILFEIAQFSLFRIIILTLGVAFVIIGYNNGTGARFLLGMATGYNVATRTNELTLYLFFGIYTIKLPTSLPVIKGEAKMPKRAPSKRGKRGKK